MQKYNDEEISKLLGTYELEHLISIHLPGKAEPEQLTPSAFHQLLGIHYWSTLHVASLDRLKKIQTECPWMIKHTFWGVENRDLGALYKDNLWAGVVADVTIRWIDDQVGFGVFANRAIQEGEYVGEFIGDVHRLYRMHPVFNAYCFHYPTRFWSYRYYVVDASQGGNETRFINHSDDPNLIPQCLYDRSLLHIVFFANKAIPAGAQLTYNYGKDFWKHRQKVDLNGQMDNGR